LTPKSSGLSVPKTSQIKQDGKVQDRQKPCSSGKKKAHTLKNQAAISPTGLVEHASESVLGRSTHDVTLLRQTDLLSELADDEATIPD